jgi:hypothetical protein
MAKKQRRKIESNARCRKPAEIRMFLNGTLDAVRSRDLTDLMLAAGLPL